MRGPRQFTANNHTLRECVGFAYDLSPSLISGGPAGLESERYDIAAELQAAPVHFRPAVSAAILILE